jgi:hypothetical protein
VERSAAAVERLAEKPIDADQAMAIVEAGLSHELYRRVVGRRAQ